MVIFEQSAPWQCKVLDSVRPAASSGEMSWIHSFGDWGLGTVETTRATGDDLTHIGVHWLHTCRMMMLMVDVRMVILLMIFVMDLMFNLRTNSKVGDGFGAEHDDGCDDDDDDDEEEEEDDKDDDHDDGDGWWWRVMLVLMSWRLLLTSQFGRILYNDLGIWLNQKSTCASLSKSCSDISIYFFLLQYTHVSVT